MEFPPWYVGYLMAAERGWFSFWHVLWSGEWVANVGLPMIVSLAALLIAYQFFRTQLAHDRRLAAEQADRDRAAGADQAQRDRELMQEQILLSRQESERERRCEAMRLVAIHLYALGINGDSGKVARPINMGVLLEVIERATFAVGDQPIFHQIRRAAQGCNARANVVERWRQTHEGDSKKFPLYFANLDFFANYMLEMRLLAGACFKWDGVAELGEVAEVHAPTAEQVDVLSPTYDEFRKELQQEWDDLTAAS